MTQSSIEKQLGTSHFFIMTTPTPLGNFPTTPGGPATGGNLLPPQPPPSGGTLPGVALQMASFSAQPMIPTTPIMGGLVQSSKDEFAAWMGGKPLVDWSGLHPSSSTKLHVPTQAHPTSVSLSAKAYGYHTTGFETKFFTKDKDFMSFSRKVPRHLEDHGMDTISFLPDPLDKNKMISVVKNHARFSLEYAQVEYKKIKNSMDAYDISNHEVAMTFLCNSLDPDLEELLDTHMDEDEAFPIAWLCLMDLIVSSSINKFETIKDRIKKCLPSQYKGQDIIKLSQDFQTDAKELTIAGQYDHNLTLKILQIFLLAGGNGSEAARYHHKLCNLETKLNATLKLVATMEKSDATKYLKQENLMYHSICQLAEECYQDLHNNGLWPPAKHAQDSKAIPSTFANLTSIDLLTLIQNALSSFTGKCHKCGEVGHMASACPSKKPAPVPSHSPSKGKQETRHNSKKWCYTPPGSGSPKMKVIDGLTFCWCEKCSHWTMTHDTNSHQVGVSKGKKEKPCGPSSNHPSSNSGPSHPSGQPLSGA